MTTMTVIEADLDRLDHQQAVREQVAAFARDPLSGQQELSPETLDRLIAGLRTHPTTLVFLALAGEQPVGLAVCFLGFSTFAARPLINIHDLAVHARFRRQGLGRRLLAAIEEKARALGCCKLTLEVHPDNDVARHLYRSFGFDGRRENAGQQPDLFLEKRL
jgi:ribosomal protein S18 acetylase RimI-like enzyme